jgi:hypothetical protein
MNKLTQFDFLLNALEDAVRSHRPLEMNYAEKRRLLFAYVRALEARDAAPQVDGVPSPVTFELLEMLGEGGRTYYRVSMKRGDSVATVQGTYHKPSALKMLEEWQRRFGDGPAAAAHPQPAAQEQEKDAEGLVRDTKS